MFEAESLPFYSFLQFEIGNLCDSISRRALMITVAVHLLVGRDDLMLNKLIAILLIAPTFLTALMNNIVWLLNSWNSNVKKYIRVILKCLSIEIL